jgi:hypothetical protein
MRPFSSHPIVQTGRRASMPPAAPRAVGMSRALTPVARPRAGSYEEKALSGHTMRRSKSGIAVGNSLLKCSQAYVRGAR